MVSSIKFVAVFLLMAVSILNVNTNENLCPNFLDLCRLCSCYESSDRISLNCRIRNKFGLLPKLFRYLHYRAIGHAVFEDCSAGTLQSNVFTKTKISSLVLFCPFKELDLHSLSRIISLESLTMHYAKFPRIPPAVSELNTLLKLRIEAGHILQIGNELHNLTRLATISLSRNRIETVHRDAFMFNENLQSVDLSYNRIKMLDSGILRFCRYIKFFLVTRNNLVSIRGILSASKHSLQVINLRRNRLRTIEKIFSTYRYVREIDVGENNLHTLSDDTFGEKTQDVKKLILDRCKLSLLPPKLLKSMIYLVTINLSYNKIYIVPDKFFHDLKFLKVVELAGNYLITLDNIFMRNSALRLVFLQGNAIKYIGNAFKNATTLKELDLEKNQLTELKEIEFKDCSALEGMNVNDNRVSIVEKNVFSSMKILRALKLRNNKISSLNDSLQNLTYLEYLSLEFNHLQTITESDMLNLSHLKWLFLWDNKLKSVRFAFKHLESLQSLKIQNNQLETLLRNSLPRTVNLQVLDLSGNEWQCDCRLLWLQELLTNESIKYLNEPICQGPTKFKGRRLKQLSPEDLKRWLEGCPEPCICTCENDIENFSIKVDCSGKQLSEIPSYFPSRVGQLDLQDNLLTNPLYLDSEALGSLWYLNLEKNCLEVLELILPENVKVLKLANNNLTRFFESPPRGIALWTLSNNPWKCDCETVDFWKWMFLHHNKILDVNETRCGPSSPRELLNNKVIISLKETDLCPSLISIYVIASISILITLLFGTTSRLMYSRYHYHIKVWLYSRGVTWLKRDNDRDQGKTYDAFVSSADEDLYWVMEFILPELENRAPFYTLFEPRRDMRAGEMFELEKEMEEVTNSKRIIILLSESYIHNNFLMELFKFAFLSSVEEKTYRLILIIVGDLPPLSDIDSSLKAAVESTRCLRFDQKLFWEMLRFAMPKKDPEQNDFRGKSEEDAVMLR